MLSLLLTACPREDIRSSDPNQESWTTGSLTVFCDESVKDLLDSTFIIYDERYEDVQLTLKYGNSRNVMSQLLSGHARAIVTPRGYLKDEDSLMKAFKVKTHPNFTIAHDALVFFVNKEFPADTLFAKDIENYFSVSDNHYLSNDITTTVVFALADQNSSEYMNFDKMVLKNKKSTKKLILFVNTNEAKEFVSEKDNRIGVAFLSQLVNDDRFKMLRLSFEDSSTYVSPKPVHQGYVVQGLYPYIVDHKVYLKEDIRNLPYWFATFLEKEFVVQSYFNRSGIVPAFAKIALIPEE